MRSFKKPEKQAEEICKKLSYNGDVASLSTSLSYQECLKQVVKSDFAKQNKFSLQNMTVNNCNDYLKIRAHEVGQKQLDMERQALQAMSHFITRTLPSNGSLEIIKADKQQVLKTRIYTPHQFNRLTSKMREKNTLSNEISLAAGLRAHEFLTILPIQERNLDKRETIETKFLGLEGKVYTVVGKGGLVREVMIPSDLAAKLDDRRLEKSVRVNDRGIWYVKHYDVSGGQRWSNSFCRASKEALGWSNGAHGLRHTYAQNRMKELVVTLKIPWLVALKTVSIELGHFRTSITLTYLR